MGNVTTVGGLEQFIGNKGSKTGIDVQPLAILRACPFCGHEAGFRESPRRGVGDEHRISVHCANGSCAVHTPEHYSNRESAAAAWNRRT